MIAQLNQTALSFTENFKFSHGELLEFDAVSFQDWLDETLPQAVNLKPCTLQEAGSGDSIDLGKFRLLRFTLPTHSLRQNEFFGVPLGKATRTRETLRVYQGSKLAHVGFSDAVHIPVLVEPRQSGNWKVWMSLTPMEIATCRGGVRKAFGEVLLGGMGLGWMAKRIAARKQVSKLAIVDWNLDVLNFVGKALREEFPGKKIELIHDDVWKHIDSHRSYDSFILDVWESYGRAEYDKYFVDLKKWCEQNDRRVWGWGDVKHLPEG